MMELFKKTEKKRQTPVYFSIDLKQTILNIPDMPADRSQLDVTYDLVKPYASVHIYWDRNINELVYSVLEPELDENEKSTLELVEEGIRELINISFLNANDEKTVMEYLERNVRIILNEFHIRMAQSSFLKIMYYIWRNFVGLNEIEILMRDYYIEDIECNGFNTPIYIIHRKYRNLRTNVQFNDLKTLTSFVEKLAQKCGQYISYATPLLDGRMPDGSRINATYSSDVATRGPNFTMRKFTSIPWTPIKMIDFRTVSPEVLSYLWILLEYGANIMIVGATASGKTSFLNAIAFFINPSARIITIEDTKEINLMHENWLPAVSRAGIGSANILGQKYGEITLFDLLRESFRQRPDYVVVGEIRGKEAFVLFQGASSGHPVISTMHAESVEALIRRLETEPINLSPTLVESLDIVCVLTHAKVDGKPVRRLQEIVEIVKVEKEVGKAVTNTPLARDPSTDRFYFKTDSHVFNRIMMRHGIPKEKLQMEFLLRAKLLYKMYQNKIFEFAEVQKIINEYYKTPDEVLKKFGIA